MRRILICLLTAVVFFGVWAFPVDAQTISLEFVDAQLSSVFESIGRIAELNVLVDPKIEGRASVSLDEVTVQEAVEMIAALHNLAYILRDDMLLVTFPERLADYQVEETRYLTLEHTAPSEVAVALEGILSVGRVAAYDQSGVLVLQGTAEKLAEAEKLVNQLDKPQVEDVPLDRPVLEILQDTARQLGLNLVADPRLAEERLVVAIQRDNPTALLSHLEQVAGVKIERSEDTLSAELVRREETEVAAESPERIKVFRLNFVEPERVSEALGMFVPDGRVRTDPAGKAVIVRTREAVLAEIDQFLAEYDVPRPQVLMEVWVQEMSSNALRNLGVDWQGIPSFEPGKDDPSVLELAWEPWELVLALKLLEEQGQAKLLANPKISAISGEEATIFVGDRVPTVLSDDEDGSRIEYIESGINLRVTPRISDDGTITIRVRPEVSTFFWRSSSDYPQIRTREAETTVRVRDGQPVVIGGLLQEEEKEMITQLPFVSKLPILGRLFQWRETETINTEMSIFLIPRIVEETH